MRIVLDTNVLISGIFFAGYPYEILDAWRQGRLEIATSPGILEEYSRVALELSAEFQEIDPHAILRLIMIESHLTAAGVRTGRPIDSLNPATIPPHPLPQERVPVPPYPGFSAVMTMLSWPSAI
ncbi:MAG: PIN domain-containing protein [Candidatus Tectomicrobia bacterium]|uniref:PIN domain-containing protein n=1 Tax=Tectimicrobiota bacterium TaxID=2528274 RepID=A0A932MLI9_UNCTE|nr:PIN domain-containing protein [Candidatus Tectomicrobia bacterium]